MAKKAAEKTAGIDMSGYKPRPKVFDGQTPLGTNKSEIPNEPSEAPKKYTGVGVFMDSMTGKTEVSNELLSAQTELGKANKKLAEFDGATLVRALDPKLVHRSQWANRIEAEFTTSEFLALKAEIENSGGNVQPIKVRVVKGVFDGQTLKHEIVFGHRRHQACLELGLLVNAVVVEDMDDKTLFETMDRENRGRKNLSAWEQGRMYDDALKKGLYPSIRKLVESLGVNLSDASRSVQLAKLPKDVVSAFASPLDLQVRWAKPLTDALQRNPDGVLAIAREVKKDRNGMAATDVFARLIGKGGKPSQKEIEISARGVRVATLKPGMKGRAVVEFEPGALPIEKHEALAKLITDFLMK